MLAINEQDVITDLNILRNSLNTVKYIYINLYLLMIK